MTQTEMIQSGLFDYAGLDTETRIVVQQRTSEIKTLMRRSAQDIIDIGQKLIEVKEKLGHGRFGGWLESEFSWTDKTARRFMSVAESFKLDNLSDLSIAPSALYALAAPSTPEPARIEAVQRAQTGESITHSTAKSIIEDYKPKVAPVVVSKSEEKPAPVDEYKKKASNFEESRNGYTWSQTEPAKPIERIQTPFPVIVVPIDDVEDDEEVPVPVVVKSKMDVHFSSETPEHYTPKEIIDAAISCMGAIDLDPCSNSHTNPNVPAAAHYTRDDDGLAHTWHGSVYMNPPYGREIIDWVEKLATSYEKGDIQEAIALVPARTDTKWWSMLRDYPVCLVQGRLKFGDAENGAPFPSAVFYLGENVSEFYYAFSGIGDIWQRLEPGMFGE